MNVREQLLSGIRDNHSRGKVADFLTERVSSGSLLSFVSAYFTIYAYEALSGELDQIKHLNFLFGEPRFIASLDPEKTDKKAFQIEDEGLELANRLQQKDVARRCAEWIRGKVDIRSIRQANLLHGKLYHIDDGRREHALLGSSNFTRRGLGVSAMPNIELNLVVDSDRDRADLKRWFDDIWADESLVADVKDEVLRYLEQLYVIRWCCWSSPAARRPRRARAPWPTSGACVRRCRPGTRSCWRSSSKSSSSTAAAARWTSTFSPVRV